MSIRAATMNRTDSISRERKPKHTLRRLFLLLLLVAAYALTLVHLVRREAEFPYYPTLVFTDGVLAVISGFGARLVFSSRGWFVRTLAAALAVLSGLALLGYFTDWTLGIHVIYLSRGYIRWADLFHLTFGISIAWAALWAWHKPRRQRVEVRSTADQAPTVPPVRRRINLPSSGSVRGDAALRPQVRTSLTGGIRTPGRARSNRRNPFAQRPQVQLAMMEEHRCPYCLEPVSRNDPGGVKECPICHSVHHADCWEVTGTCQVPHLNS